MLTSISHLFDNNAMIIAAICVSLWSALYLELWKQYSAKITHRWDLSNFDNYDEFPRPEFLVKLDKAPKKKNVVTVSFEQSKNFDTIDTCTDHRYFYLIENVRTGSVLLETTVSVYHSFIWTCAISCVHRHCMW